MEYNNPSEIVKTLTFGKDAKQQVMQGVEKLSNAVKSTLGASGKCVIYEDAPWKTGDYKRWCNRCRKRSLITSG